MTNFSYSFDDLEIFEGVHACGEADFSLVKGEYKMTSLSLGWNKKNRVNISNTNAELFSLCEAALAKHESDTGYLTDAFEKEQAQEREYLRDFEDTYWNDANA